MKSVGGGETPRSPAVGGRLKVSTTNKDVKPAEVVLTLEMSTDPSNIGDIWKELGHEIFLN